MYTKNTFSGPFFWWIYTSLAAAALCGLVYVTVQQNYRMSVNDPQIQLAEDAAQALQSGAVVSTQVPAGSVDVAVSLAPFIVIYDSQGKPIEGNGYLGESFFAAPTGMFQNIKAGGESRLTLEPQSGIRIAAVVVPFQGHGTTGFVLAGRSLREVEVRENKLTLMVFFGWLVTVVFLFVVSLVYRFIGVA